MALESQAALAEIRDSLLETYASNDAMNQLIVSHLDPRAWRAQLPGQKGKGRTIAAIFAHLHKQSACMVEEFCATSEVPTATRSPPLHHEAGCCRAQEKRDAVPAHADGRIVGRSESPSHKILSRQLDADVARRRHHVRLHVFARGPSSRPDFDAGTPARLPRSLQDSRHLALGEALATSGPYHAPALSGTRPPSWLVVAPACPEPRRASRWRCSSSWASRTLGCCVGMDLVGLRDSPLHTGLLA
jgi:hypothetical protein